MFCLVKKFKYLPEEQPSRDETFISLTWWFSHDVQVRWVETESGSGETVSDLKENGKFIKLNKKL
jgi:hypothetical protein